MSHAKFQVLTMPLDKRGSGGKGWNFVWGNNEFWLNWRLFCMNPHFLFFIFSGYFCYHSSQSLFQVGKNIIMLYDNCRKDAGNRRKWKKWWKNSPPTPRMSRDYKCTWNLARLIYFSYLLIWARGFDSHMNMKKQVKQSSDNRCVLACTCTPFFFIRTPFIRTSRLKSQKK